LHAFYGCERDGSAIVGRRIGYGSAGAVKSVYIVPLFILLGAILEFAALFIGVGFTGVKDFGPHWGFAVIYFLGFWPDRLLPSLPPRWGELYLTTPIMGWALIGALIALWMERREKSLRAN
jgi:hypothetical protein